MYKTEKIFKHPTSCPDCGKGCWYSEPCQHCELTAKAEIAKLREDNRELREALSIAQDYASEYRSLCKHPRVEWLFMRFEDMEPHWRSHLDKLKQLEGE